MRRSGKARLSRYRSCRPFRRYAALHGGFVPSGERAFAGRTRRDCEARLPRGLSPLGQFRETGRSERRRPKVQMQVSASAPNRAALASGPVSERRTMEESAVADAGGGCRHPTIVLMPRLRIEAQDAVAPRVRLLLVTESFAAWPIDDDHLFYFALDLRGALGGGSAGGKQRGKRENEGCAHPSFCVVTSSKSTADLPARPGPRGENRFSRRTMPLQRIPGCSRDCDVRGAQPRPPRHRHLS